MEKIQSRLNMAFKPSETIFYPRVIVTPDYKYAETPAEERWQLLQNLYTKAELDLVLGHFDSKVWHRSGYFFFPDIKPMKYRDLNELQYLRKLKKSRSTLLHTDAVTTPEEQEALELLTSVYKMHLQPRDEFVPHIVKSLLKELKTNPDFREAICSFKVRARQQSEMTEADKQAPIIVIYPQPGRESAQKVLDIVYQLFHDQGIFATGDEPALNYKIDDLIFYAHGDRDWKKPHIKYMQDRYGATSSVHGLLEPDGVHFRGDYRLYPPTKKYQTERMAKLDD